jgi:signal transduction histidine kinase
MNLIVNACDAVKTKQRQNSKALGLVDISCLESQNHIVVTVKDNGCGMNEQTKNKLFEPFYTTKGVGEGTGLGLAISFGIISAHDGTIEVSSIEGEGTTIKVYLPC